MAYNFPGMPAMTPMGMGPMGPLGPLASHQGFMELASQGFPPLPPPLPLPGMNDSPLEFSTNKNQPPAVRESTEDPVDRRCDKNPVRRDREARDTRDNGRRSRGERNDRKERDRDRERREERNDRERRVDDRRIEERASSANSNHNSNDLAPITPTVTTSTANVSQIDQTSGVWGMGMDYSIMGMNPMGAMGPMIGEMALPHMGHGYGPMGIGMMHHEGAILGPSIISPESIVTDIAAQIMGSGIPPPPSAPQTTKEIVHLKSCTLIPPNPNAPPPTTRERPPGCRTIFVGGLPENITEAMIQEIFERCGEITTLRLSKKNFCHIRFGAESSVDSAIFLSGYRVRIGSGVEAANTGRLYVDYAHIYARDDQYEWECKQRQLQRMQRHREQVEEERQRMQSSPPPVVHYTDYEASNICEKIKQDDTFMKAVQIVVTWLERGDCTKRNANTFYSMIQSTNSHVRRLLTERASYEEELQRAKELMKGRMQGLLIQCK
uniref:Enox1_0 protein n=1 Tax=Fopius arisanus TaxID=64838 RepID=A0A0C9QNE3_9HYME